jgi:hypothetical protein
MRASAVLDWDALICVVYWHLSNIMTADLVDQCEICETLFEKRSPLDRRCPSDSSPRGLVSLCADGRLLGEGLGVRRRDEPAGR